MNEKSARATAVITQAVLLPAGLGLACSFLSIRYFGTYGMAMFIGVPIVVSFGAGLMYGRMAGATPGKAYGVAVLSMLALGGFILLFALDGLVCLLMALPLGLIVALPGGEAGFYLGRRLTRPRSAALNILLFCTLPLLMGFEHRLPATSPTHAVVSTVTVHAPIENVWDGVVAFDPIVAPPRGIFRMGIAYPIEAVIEGAGVGAIRRCVFSTGAFVEPIIEWDEPNTLTFDVSENPPAMKEFSIYSELDVPHLLDTFFATKGQFKLRQEGNTTILEGTTWYKQKIYPDWYWHHISDEIIHRIHLRVLEHIKKEVEGGLSESAIKK